MNDKTVPVKKDAVRHYLSQHGWPCGLQESMIKSFESFPVRFFLVDDSGSMAASDGKYVSIFCNTASENG